MKKFEKELPPPEVKPVNKATMDQPQEEFIADEAGVMADDQDGRSSKELPTIEEKKPPGSASS